MPLTLCALLGCLSGLFAPAPARAQDDGKSLEDLGRLKRDVQEARNAGEKGEVLEMFYNEEGKDARFSRRDVESGASRPASRSSLAAYRAFFAASRRDGDSTAPPTPVPAVVGYYFAASTGAAAGGSSGPVDRGALWGAIGGGLAGALIGFLLAGPIGAAIGLLIGIFIGALLGKLGGRGILGLWKKR